MRTPAGRLVYGHDAVAIGHAVLGQQAEAFLLQAPGTLNTATVWEGSRPLSRMPLITPRATRSTRVLLTRS